MISKIDISTWWHCSKICIMCICVGTIRQNNAILTKMPHVWDITSKQGTLWKFQNYSGISTDAVTYTVFVKQMSFECKWWGCYRRKSYAYAYVLVLVYIHFLPDVCVRQCLWPSTSCPRVSVNTYLKESYIIWPSPPVLLSMILCEI